jgi:hypothetical protein
MSDLPLPPDELFVLGTWAVQAVAANLGIDEDDAYGLLENAEPQGRVQILGDGRFAGVQVDGRWVLRVSRARLAEAAHEWQVLRFAKRQFED